MDGEIEVGKAPSPSAPESALERALGGLPEDPAARAEERVRRLRATFATTLGLIAEMYQDRDWEHLRREDGSTYSSLSEVLSDVLSVSLSMARRYVQGARDFYLPLLEMTVEGTRIEITSSEVASLGSEGLEDAVSTAREQLDGVDDAEEAGEIIDGAVDAAQERKAARAAAEKDSGGDGGDWGAQDGDNFEGFDPANSSPRGGYDGDAMDDLPDEEEPPPEDLGGVTYTGTELDEEDAVPVDDAARKIMQGAPAFNSVQELAGLPDEVREAYLALRTLAEMDPEQIAALLNYDTRGVLTPIDDAVSNAKRLRGEAETATWFLSRLA